MILSKMVYNFEMVLNDIEDSTWLNQRAYLVFEPKALQVKLSERSAKEY